MVSSGGELQREVEGERCWDGVGGVRGGFVTFRYLESSDTRF
jgi:hypothetical protein